MEPYKRNILLVLASLACISTRAPAEDKDKDKDKDLVKIDLRWIAPKPIPGVTVDYGFQTSETGELSYLYKKPVLSHDDIESASMQKTTFGASKTSSGMYIVQFRLKKEALQKLAAACDKEGRLAVMIDGRPWGNAFYIKSRDLNNFSPFTGYFQAEADAARIVAAFK